MRALSIGTLLAMIIVPTAVLGQGNADSLLTRDNGAFAVDLYRQLCQDDGNLVFSPYSVTSGLAMAYAGARGETAAEMAAALHFGLPPAELHAAMGRLERQLAAINLGHWCKFAVANALWGQEGFAYKEDFLAIMESAYGAPLREVDFERPEEAFRIINNWADKKTRGKIQDLIPAGALNLYTRLVLANAIYFKGAWRAHFSKDKTRDEPFHLLDGIQVIAPLMRQCHAFPYVDLDSLQVTELPYGDGDLAMLLALPRDLQGLPSLEQSLSGDLLDAWIASLQETDVQIFLPRFSARQSFHLAGTLKSMGMHRAFFFETADFSGMSNTPLFVSAVLHRSSVLTDELGTEAAAGTAVPIEWGIPPQPRTPPVFRADHPFLFMIRHRPSGCILFMGRVLDPTR